MDVKSFTVKNVHTQSENDSIVANNAKHRAYGEQVMIVFGAGKHFVYIDDYNVNLFCTRTFGRSKAGEGAFITVPGS